MKKILVINGPNLNLLGEREKTHYGSDTLQSINEELSAFAKENAVEVDFYQSNIEGELVDALHRARKEFAGVVINAGAYTHYSIALRDAISAIKIPVVEVHLSNIDAREEFRRTSMIGPVCIGSIAGFGKQSYFLALQALITLLKGENR